MQISYFITVVLTLFPFFINAQDIITKTDGTKIYCKIINEDSISIYFETEIKNIKKATSVRKSNVISVAKGNTIAYNETITDLPIITYRKGISRYHYFVGNNVLNRDEIAALLSQYPAAYKRYRKGFNNNLFATILGFGGGYLMGHALGKYIFKRTNQFETEKFLIGGGISIISLLMDSAGNNQRSEAIEMYNASVLTSKKIGFIREPVILDVHPPGIYISF